MIKIKTTVMREFTVICDGCGKTKTASGEITQEYEYERIGSGIKIPQIQDVLPKWKFISFTIGFEYGKEELITAYCCSKKCFEKAILKNIRDLAKRK